MPGWFTMAMGTQKELVASFMKRSPFLLTTMKGMGLGTLGASGLMAVFAMVQMGAACIWPPAHTAIWMALPSPGA